MPKLVCDFNQVNTIINKMKQEASNLELSINQNTIKTESSTSGWRGTAKVNYMNSSKKNEDILIERVNILEETINNFKAAVDNIEAVENDFSSIDI